MPTLAVVLSECEFTCMGSLTAAIIWLAIFALTAGVVVFSSMMTNSSPPHRDIKSLSLSVCLKRLAISMSTLSPMSCPSVSFITLNLSRSIKSSARFSCLRFAIVNACSRYSSKWVRL